MAQILLWNLDTGCNYVTAIWMYKFVSFIFVSIILSSHRPLKSHRNDPIMPPVLILNVGARFCNNFWLGSERIIASINVWFKMAWENPGMSSKYLWCRLLVLDKSLVFHNLCFVHLWHLSHVTTGIPYTLMYVTEWERAFLNHTAVCSCLAIGNMSAFVQVGYQMYWSQIYVRFPSGNVGSWNKITLVVDYNVTNSLQDRDWNRFEEWIPEDFVDPPAPIREWITNQVPSLSVEIGFRFKYSVRIWNV